MATGTCEVLEEDLECPEATEELPELIESIPELSREDVSKDSEVPTSKEDVNSTSHGVEEEARQQLHVIEKDLEEFVESMVETPASPEKDVMGMEEMVEKPSSALPQVPKTLPVKRKAESCTIGPRKADPRWDGLTLNKCILIASFVALLSMGFQVFQDVIDIDDEVSKGDPRLWSQPESRLPEDSADEQAEPWFFKSWFSWLEPEDTEGPEATAEGMQPDSAAHAEPERGQEKPSILEKKEEKPRGSLRAQPPRGSKKERQPKDGPPESKTSKMHRIPPASSDQEEEEEGEEQPHNSKRAHGEGKQREGKERPRREEGKSRHPKPKSQSQGPGRKEHRHDERRKQDYKQHKGEPKSGKPWEQHVSFAHKVKEGKRHD